MKEAHVQQWPDTGWGFSSDPPTGIMFSVHCCLGLPATRAALCCAGGVYTKTDLLVPDILKGLFYTRGDTRLSE